MKNILILICLMGITMSAQTENKLEDVIDVDSISLKGLDRSVKEAFQETKKLILESRKQKDESTESDASSQWCLMLHNYDFLSEAKQCYLVVGKKDKENAKWPYLFAKASIQQSNQDEAIIGFNETLKRDPIYLPAHYFLIEMQLQNGNLKSAFELLNQVPVELQLSHSILKLKGDLNFEVKNHYIAIGYYQQIKSQLPEAGSLNYKIAQSYMALGDEQNAEFYASESNSIGVTVNDPYYQEVKQQTVGEIPFLIKAKRAFSYQRYDEAIESYKKALEFNPESESGLVNLAVSYFNNQQIELSKNTFQKALEINPGQKTALYNLASISLSENNYVEATRLYEKYFQLNSSDSEVLDKLVALYYQIGQYQKLVNLLDGINGTKLSKYQFEKSKALVQLGQFDQAIIALNNILEAEPNDIKSLLSLSKIYSQAPNKNLRDGSKAILYSQKAFSLHKNVKTFWNLIHAYDEASECSKRNKTIDEFVVFVKSTNTEVIDELKRQRVDGLNCN